MEIVSHIKNNKGVVLNHLQGRESIKFLASACQIVFLNYHQIAFDAIRCINEISKITAHP